MTAHQAVCHLSDSFRSMMSPTADHVDRDAFLENRHQVDRAAGADDVAAGVKTRPEVDQEIGGTKPVEFARDRRELEALIEEFAARGGERFQPHPMFGRLTTGEWHRWGWLHTDHHFRQFGV